MKLPVAVSPPVKFSKTRGIQTPPSVHLTQSCESVAVANSISHEIESVGVIERKLPATFQLSANSSVGTMELVCHKAS